MLYIKVLLLLIEESDILCVLNSTDSDFAFFSSVPLCFNIGLVRLILFTVADLVDPYMITWPQLMVYTETQF